MGKVITRAMIEAVGNYVATELELAQDATKEALVELVAAEKDSAEMSHDIGGEHGAKEKS